MELLSVSRTTLHRYQESGKIPYYRLGRKVYYLRSEIIAAVTANRVAVESEEIFQAA